VYQGPGQASHGAGPPFKTATKLADRANGFADTGYGRPWYSWTRPPSTTARAGLSDNYGLTWTPESCYGSVSVVPGGSGWTAARIGVGDLGDWSGPVAPRFSLPGNSALLGPEGCQQPGRDLSGLTGGGGSARWSGSQYPGAVLADQAPADQVPQVQCRGAAVEPDIVLGHPAVAELEAAAPRANWPGAARTRSGPTWPRG
jgi:hypothetical protein